MQIKPAIIANPGKAAAGHAVNGARGDHGSGGTGGIGGIRAGSNPHSEGNDKLHAFGSALDNALQGRDTSRQAFADARLQAQRNENAATPAKPATASAPATPAVPAHVAAPTGDEEKAKDDDAPPADEALDGGLQAFVNSLQTPVTAMAMPAATAVTEATATAATDPEADDVAALVTDADGQGQRKGRAFGLDDMHEGSARKQSGAAPGLAADAIAEAAGKVDGQEPHAAWRAQEITASQVAPEFRAALNDAQAMRPALQDALAAENGNSALAQTLAAVATGGTTGATGASAATAPTANAALVTPHLHAPQWQDAFGQQVLWIAKHEQQIASITMNPPELGPVRVTLSFSDGQASAAFVSHQPEVRQAIQDAVPRLKEMFADAGLQLQQASVDSGDAGRHAASRAQAESGSGRSRANGSDIDADDAANLAMSTDADSSRAARRIAAARLVDLFA